MMATKYVLLMWMAIAGSVSIPTASGSEWEGEIRREYAARRVDLDRAYRRSRELFERDFRHQLETLHDAKRSLLATPPCDHRHRQLRTIDRAIASLHEEAACRRREMSLAYRDQTQMLLAAMNAELREVRYSRRDDHHGAGCGCDVCRRQHEHVPPRYGGIDDHFDRGVGYRSEREFDWGGLILNILTHARR